MKFSKRLTIEIPMKEFYFFATPTVLDKKQLHKAIKDELFHSWNGIVDGRNVDWKRVFYYQLWEQGFIVQTKESIKWYGDFSK